VVGISFVDILIQAVFVLLIALIVGYVDPAVKIEIEQASEYGQIGKDLCHKLNKDSLNACREHIEGKRVSVDSPSDSRFSEIGRDYCRSIGAPDVEECRKRSDTKLRPCVKPTNEFTIPSSLTFSLVSPSQVEFKGFSSMFLSKLKEERDLVRYQRAINVTSGTLFLPSRIEDIFGFIREPGCFHRITVLRPGRYSDDDLKEARDSLNRLVRPAD